MKIIEPSFSFMHLPDGEFVLRHLEQAARTCYKSENKAGPDTASSLMTRIIRNGVAASFGPDTVERVGLWQ